MTPNPSRGEFICAVRLKYHEVKDVNLNTERSIKYSEVCLCCLVVAYGSRVCVCMPLMHAMTVLM